MPGVATGGGHCADADFLERAVTVKKAMTAIVLLILISLLPLGANAEGTATFDFFARQQEAAPGESLSFLLSLNGKSGERLSTFRMRVAFDPSCLEFRGLQEEGETGEKEYRFHEKEGEVIIIYLAENGGVALDGTQKELLSLRFLAKKQAPDGDVEVRAVVDGVGSDNLQTLNPEENLAASARVVTPDFSLASLKPDTGRLIPDFRPDQYSYSLDVEYPVEQITFYASPVNEEAVVKVSRRTLDKAGSTTKIQITVRSPNGDVQKTYEVAVNRQPKPASVSAAGGGMMGNSRRPFGSSNVTSSSLKKEESANSSKEVGSGQAAEETQRMTNRTGLIQRENHMTPFLLGGAVFLIAAIAIVWIQQRAEKSNRPRKKTTRQGEDADNE